MQNENIFEREIVQHRPQFERRANASITRATRTYQDRGDTYAARIKPIRDCGQLLIPRSEVDSLLAR
jgi:hypothetical protein